MKERFSDIEDRNLEMAQVEGENWEGDERTL